MSTSLVGGTKVGADEPRFHVPRCQSSDVFPAHCAKFVEGGRPTQTGPGPRRVGSMAAIGIVGDYQPQNRTHQDTNEALAQLGLHAEWVPTETVERAGEATISSFDA